MRLSKYLSAKLLPQANRVALSQKRSFLVLLLTDRSKSVATSTWWPTPAISCPSSEREARKIVEEDVGRLGVRTSPRQPSARS